MDGGLHSYEVLAIWGALMGSLASGAQFVSVMRDRPRLIVGFGFNTSIHERPHCWLTVLNAGRQPITVRTAGFYGSELDVEIDSVEHGKLVPVKPATYQFPMIREPVLLDPGQMHKGIAFVPDSFEWGYHFDFPLRAYADDARGRRTWGKAGPIVRMTLGEGPFPEVPQYLTVPLSRELLPARVLPPWKFWRRPELRRGNPGRPSAEDLKGLATGLAHERQ